MKVLQADDMNVDDEITVIRNDSYQETIPDENGGTTVVVHKDNTHVGAVLKIKAIDLPFIVVEEVTDRLGIKGTGSRWSLNVRKTTFGKVSKEYSDALGGK